MPVILTVPYLFIGLAGCSVDPKINRDARKLVRTAEIIKKKKKILWSLTRSVGLYLKKEKPKSFLCLASAVSNKDPPPRIERPKSQKKPVQASPFPVQRTSPHGGYVTGDHSPLILYMVYIPL
jgi:hypothetical protein